MSLTDLTFIGMCISTYWQPICFSTWNIVGPTQGGNLHQVITNTVKWANKRLNLCVEHMQSLSQHSFLHVSKPRTSFQAFCQYISWRRTLGSHILTSPSCAVANRLLVTRFHFTCDTPPTTTYRNTHL